MKLISMGFMLAGLNPLFAQAQSEKAVDPFAQGQIDDFIPDHVDLIERAVKLETLMRKSFDAEWNITRKENVVIVETKKDFARFSPMELKPFMGKYRVEITIEPMPKKEKMLEMLRGFDVAYVNALYGKSSIEEAIKVRKRLEEVKRPNHIDGIFIFLTRKGWDAAMSGAYDDPQFDPIDQWLDSNLMPIPSIDLPGYKKGAKGIDPATMKPRD